LQSEAAATIADAALPGLRMVTGEEARSAA
jgi:hypothetical protein